jgi:Zn-dependent M16 (insulinase) family peptidase
MTASLTNMGHRYVNLRLRSNFNEAGWVNEQMSGISYLFFLRRLIDQIDQNWEQVHERLEAIRQTLLNRSSMLCNVTTDAAGWGSAQPELGSFLAGLPDAAVAREPWVQSTVPVSEGLTLPSQVNFVGKAANLYQNGYRMHGSEMVITSHLGGTWLWDRVRVQGGAYGSFCQFDQNTGVVSFLSYRDPNVERTLDTYDQAGSFLREMELDDAELSKAIIGTIGDLDAYQLPDAKGYTALVRHLIGYTDEQRQQWRDEVLATRREDFVAFGEQLEYLREQGVVVVLGAPESVQAASESKPGWLEITRIV